MLAESLHRLGAKPRTLILYGSDLLSPTDGKSFNGGDSETLVARLIKQAEVQYGAQTKAVHLLTSSTVSDPTWAQAFTKLLAFNRTEFKRVLALDSDSTILQPLDDLFLLPPTPVAMPRAYWLNDTLNSQMALIMPSDAAYKAVEARVSNALEREFDMEIINALYADSCLVIPHRPYTLLSGELRSSDHTAYLGNEQEEWDVARVLLGTRYVHFSDWPVPKPWLPVSEGVRKEQEPKCKKRATGVDAEGRLLEEEYCAERFVWRNLYGEFRERRKRVCGAEFATWEPEERALKGRAMVAKDMAQGAPVGGVHY